jgi:hypothetical protein
VEKSVWIWILAILFILVLGREKYQNGMNRTSWSVGNPIKRKETRTPAALSSHHIFSHHAASKDDTMSFIDNHLDFFFCVFL